MIGSIIELLAELGLIREDFKHQKRVSKKEKEDGIKRPFQKYLLQPSAIMLIGVLAIGSLSAILFFTYQISSIFPEKTKKEMSEISDRMEKWYEKFEQYPVGLKELIGNSPLRQDWEVDAWDQPYRYTVMENGKGFLITSAGPDRKFGTEDDIESE